MNEELNSESLAENIGNTENASAENSLATKEILGKLRGMLENNDLNRTAIDALKQEFYKIQSRQLVSAGEENPGVVPSPGEEENELKEILAEIKEKRQQQVLLLQKQENENLAKKTEILNKLDAIKAQTDSAESVNALMLEVRNLQQEWKATGEVPADKKTQLNKTYQRSLDEFYDFIKISNELREYDLKKNLETKTHLCEKAESLLDDADIQNASKVLQMLHKEWVETGPVARDVREALWERFKDATSKINKKHQQYFEDRKAAEAENLEKKMSLCEKAESVDFSLLKTFKDWENKTKEVMAWQQEWKEIGFVPKKSQVHERFRKACNEFFKLKNDFFKNVRTELSQNLAKKNELCEKVEALKDSTDWKTTADKIIQLQKEWKKIGATNRKQSDAVWKRFSDACDHFFNNRKQQMSEEQTAQKENLKAKMDVIERIKALAGDAKQMMADLKSLTAEWNAIGHVPFGKKDSVYEQYRQALNEKFDSLHNENQNQQMQMFEMYVNGLASEQDVDKLYRRLQKDLERLTLEIASYENNMSFFSFDSKNADGLKKEMEKNIERLKKEKELTTKKLQVLKSK